MIKLKRIIFKHGETTLIFDVDFPDGSARETEIPLSEVVERLKMLMRLTGRKPTSQDAIPPEIRLHKMDKHGLGG